MPTTAQLVSVINNKDSKGNLTGITVNIQLTNGSVVLNQSVEFSADKANNLKSAIENYTIEQTKIFNNAISNLQADLAKVTIVVDATTLNLDPAIITIAPAAVVSASPDIIK